MLELIEKEPFTYSVICITEAGMPLPKNVEKFTKNYLHLSFDDVESERRANCPTEEDVQDAILWAKNKTNLVVSCLMGISRSSAIAYIIECSKKPASEAIEVLKIKHSPNALIVRMGSQLLKDKNIQKEYHQFILDKGWN